MDIQYDKVREVVEDDLLQISFSPTVEMVADGLTKPLNTVNLARFECRNCQLGQIHSG